MEILSVCNFTVRAPHVFMVLRIISTSKKIEQDAESSENNFSPTTKFVPCNKQLVEKLPTKWVEYHDGWSLVSKRANSNRPLPSQSSEKYAISVFRKNGGWVLSTFLDCCVN